MMDKLRKELKIYCDQIDALCEEDGSWAMIFSEDGGIVNLTSIGFAAWGLLKAAEKLIREGTETEAVILACPPYCIKAGEKGETLYASLDDTAQIIGPKIETVTEDFAQIRTALSEATACFIKGEQGEAPCVLVCGRTPYEAAVALQVLEKAAEVEAKAEALGGAVALDREEASAMRKNYLENYSKPEQQARERERRG